LIPKANPTYVIGALSPGLVQFRSSYLINELNPDCSEHNFLITLKATFNIFDGQERGLEIIKGLFGKGTKYDLDCIEKVWHQLKHDGCIFENFHTLTELASQAGIDWKELFNELDPSFNFCDYEVIDNDTTEVSVKAVPHLLEQYSLRGKSHELKAAAIDQSYVLPDLALRGQSTVIYAAPNTWKTLITLHLIIEAITNEQD